MFTLLIKNGTLVNANGRQKADVAVIDGKIAAIGFFPESQAQKVINAEGLYVLPGLVDTQVHMREPGLEYKENLEAGTRGAVLGGLTGVFEMPNTNPSTTTREALNEKLNRMEGRAWCNYAFYVGGTPEANVDWHKLEELPGCCGIKIFMGASTGNLLVEEDEAIRNILKKTKRRVAIHAEDNFRLKDRKHIAEKEAHPRAHPIWRDKESALLATKRVIAIARETGAKVHILHISTAEEMEYLKNCKDVATVEILPQFLYFSNEDYETIGTRIQMNPPIRDKENRKGLWKAVQNGIVDVVGSDHAPHTLEEKAKIYPQSPSGMPGVQTIVPLMLHFVNEGYINLERVVQTMSACLEPIWGVKGKGKIAQGYDADFTIVDMNKEILVQDKDMANISGWTPYHSRSFKGCPTHTIIGGNIVMENGKLNKETQGKAKMFEFN